MATWNLITKARLKARWHANDLAEKLGLQNSKSPPHRLRRILIYHGVDQRGEKKLNSRFISRDILERHFAWLAEHWHVVSLEQFVEGARHDTKPTMAITFDDGYLNNLELALPLAEKYQLPLTLFITTIRRSGFDIQWPDLLDLVAFTSGKTIEHDGRRYEQHWRGAYRCVETGASLKALGKNMTPPQLAALRKALEAQADFRKDPDWDIYWKQMSAEQIAKVAQHPLVSIGLHGDSHASFDAMSPEALRTELELSRDWLQTLCQQNIEMLAYPAGDYTMDVARIADSCGLSDQFAVELRFPEDPAGPNIMERFVINPHISFHNQRRALFKGSYL